MADAPREVWIDVDEGVWTSHPLVGELGGIRYILASAAEAEIDALRRDAERYRWLRDKSAYQWKHPIVVSQDNERIPRYLGPMLGKTLDAAIDAAMGAIPTPQSSGG